jgi:membrane dipeptidase
MEAKIKKELQEVDEKNREISSVFEQLQPVVDDGLFKSELTNEILKNLPKCQWNVNIQKTILSSTITNALIEEAKKAGKFYILPGMEGLSGIGTDLDKIDELYDFGVRHAMLTWNEQNELATGAKADPNRGLTELGRKAVRKIHDKHMIMDISHANERTFWDIAKVGGGPLMASHSNVWELRNHVRNLTDCQLLEIRDTKGIVGLNAFNELIADNREDRTVEGLIRHADYIANKIGVEHLALGFDFCEFLGDEAAGAFAEAGSINAIGLDDASHTPFMIEKMKEAGFSEKELEMICTGNWFELIKRVVG